MNRSREFAVLKMETQPTRLGYRWRSCFKMRNLMRRILLAFLALGWFVAALLLLALIALFVWLPFSDEKAIAFQPLMIQIGLIVFFAVLTYVWFLLPMRVLRGKRNENGTYLPPWVFGFFGLLMLIGGTVRVIEFNDWPLFFKAIALSVTLFSIPMWEYHYKRQYPGEVYRP